MRLGPVCLGLLVAVAAHGQRNKDDAAAAKRACGVEECFFERDVRDFEIIDATHLIVYTGSQRCAFHVEVRGTFCDLTFAPELFFHRVGDISDARGADPLADPFGAVATSRSRRDLRICSNDLNIQVHGGQFTESVSSNAPPDRFGNPRANCSISTIESVTDDQLVELYVGRGVVPPLPPMGAGEIEVGEQDEQEEE
jgi:hypothetical protein